jgi:predicted MFS family arabinose efflux permease
VTAAAFVRRPASWYGYFLIGTQIYLFNVQGNVIPFLQEEFALSYREVSLHSSTTAIGIIVTALFGRAVTVPLGRRRALWLGAGTIAAGAILLCLAPAAWASIASCLIIGIGGGLIAAGVPALLADLHGEGRRQALAEQAIVGYSYALIAPLLTGISVALGFGWRPAVIFPAIVALALITLFRRTALPPDAPPAASRHTRLSAAFWAYFCQLFFGVSLEFSVLLWASSFLERVIGFAPAAAATSVAGFYVGVLIGRAALRALITRLPPEIIIPTAVAVGLAGFALYWGVGEPWAAVPGIVMLGICVSPQYPVAVALGLGAAPHAREQASSHLTLAVGLAILLSPALLGSLADVVGLNRAHLTLPVLIAACAVSFTAARILSRRPASAGAA